MTTRKAKERDPLRVWAIKVCDWLEGQAERDEQEAAKTTFITMREAYTHDARNRRAVAKQGREALAAGKAEA